MPDSPKISAPDLTQRPPRSPRCRLGGYAILPRLLDKGRATDQHVIIDVAALREKLAAGKGDGEILEWVNANAKHKRSAWEIEQWSDFMQRRGPDGDVETLQFFTDAVGNFATTREDIKTWFDLDDLVTFGGKP